MKYEMFSDVILLEDFLDKNSCSGDVGTVVYYHIVEGLEPGYGAEFFDMMSDTVAVTTVPESYLRSPTHADIPAVRLASEVTV
jgi:hypothetical protein